MEEDLTYEEAYKELLKIGGEIVNNSVPEDVMIENVKRASVLINFCHNKLFGPEAKAEIKAKAEDKKVNKRKKGK